MGIDVPNTQQQWKDGLECIKYMYKNRNEFPNYLWLIPHRGYWKDAPENTKPAFERAMDMGYPFIECDISFCKDSVWMTKHHLNMVMYDKSTKIPSRLSSHVDGKKITDFTLCELRPDYLIIQ